MENFDDCILNLGWRPNPCEDKTGGVDLIALNNFQKNAEIGLTQSGMLIDSFDEVPVGGTASAPAQFYAIEGELEANLTTFTVERADTGSITVTYTLTIRFENLDFASTAVYNQILKGRLRALVRTNNGKTILLGYKHPGRIGGGEGGPGQLFADQSGMTVTLTFIENKLAKFLDEDAVDIIYAS